MRARVRGVRPSLPPTTHLSFLSLAASRWANCTSAGGAVTGAFILLLSCTSAKGYMIGLIQLSDILQFSL